MSVHALAVGSVMHSFTAVRSVIAVACKLDNRKGIKSSSSCNESNDIDYEDKNYEKYLN